MNRFSDPAMAFALSDKQFVAHVLATRERINRPILVGLCGAQGSGKSTTSLRLRDLLVTAGRSTVVLSLDDFYLLVPNDANWETQLIGFCGRAAFRARTMSRSPQR